MADKQNDGMFYDMKEPSQMMDYGALTEAAAYKGKGEKKFGAEFVLPADHADLAPMKEIAKSVARAEWGDGVDLSTIEWPFKNGDKASEKRIANGKAGDLYAGKVIMRPRSKFAVELVWVENGKVITAQSDSTLAKQVVGQRFYKGVLALGSFKFVAMDKPNADEGGKPRQVVCYLNKVFSTGSGDRVGGRSAEDAFKGYIGRAKAEDPTKGKVADDDISF